MKLKCLLSMLALAVVAATASVSWSQNVKVTPLGAASGEFCVGDRALLFEDPTGVRVLIAPGRTVGKDLGGTIHVRGSADERLTGGVHVLLIDHPHVDHIGDVFHANCSGSTTKAFEFPSEGNASEIAARLNSAVLVGGELPDFFTKKLNNMVTLAGTTAPVNCAAVGLNNTLTVRSEE